MISTYAFKDLMALPQSLYFRGVCPQFGIFTLNFLDETGGNLLHLSFRIDQAALVVNENLSGQWGAELATANVAFPKGLPFLIRVDLAPHNKVRVGMDERTLAEFTWRADFRAAARVDITDIDFALFREGGTIKSLPEDAPAPAVPAAVPAPESQPATVLAASDAFAQLMQRLQEARRDQHATEDRLAARLDALGAEITTLQKDMRGIAASLQALIALDVKTHAAAAAPREASVTPFRRVPTRPEPVFEDSFIDGWGAWRYHQKVKLGALGLFTIEQNRSTPGIERNAVSVAPHTYYELSVTGTFKAEAKRIYLSAFDPDNDLHLTSAAYVTAESGTASRVFMTTGRTRRLILRVLVENPAIGDECRLETIRLDALGRADLYVPASSGEAIGDKIVATMASVPGRDPMLVDAVLSLYPFVDRVRVYLNGHERVPAGLALPRVEIVHSATHGDDGDAGKFHWCEDTEHPLKLVCDDDLLYPADYVPRMVEALRRYDNKVIVGLHGILLKQPIPGYYNEQYRHVRRFLHANSVDYQVHVLGTGAVLYDARTLTLRKRDFQCRNMADIWLMEQAQTQHMPMICIARPRNWVVQNTVKGGVPTIYDASHGKDGSAFDTSLVQSAVAKAHWPITFQPVTVAGVPRKKVVMSITTWNRLDYLRECVDTFMATRSADYDWVLMIADDGSEDGTLDYLDKLQLQVELHVIRNKGRYACGQTNTIIELCETIGYDFAFTIDDDISFLKRGWDRLYIEAAAASGYPHLCHRNHKQFVNLRRRTQPDFSPPPLHIDASSKCETIVDVWSCDGCLFTFTPEVIKKVGYNDEINFPIRGQWHIDYSIRVCRAGLNDPTHFYDARDSNQYIELQANKPTYRCSLPWGPEYKKTKDPEELKRRDRVMRDETRVYIPLPTTIIPPAKPARTRKTVNSFFDRVYVLNLDRRPDWLAAIDRQMTALGITYERFRAVDGKAKPHVDEYLAYSQKPVVTVPAGLKPITRSKDFYQTYDSRIARVAFLEKTINGKAIRTPGAWGYLKSYIAILEDAIAAGYESILVLDDDALFHRNFNALFARFVEEVPDDWKILQLGALQYDWGEDWITRLSDNLYRCNGSSVGSHATGIHRSVMAMLMHQAQFFDLPLDVGALSHVKRSFAERSFTMLPNLIIQDTTESDIASSDVQQAEGQKRANVYRWTLEDYAPAPSAVAVSPRTTAEPRAATG
ncbi:MAG: glycosyltransferase [Alphaproteobacteria bacterium]|nr:glycosyltransferase [Alphaproteobacteria bacterium]